MILKYEWLDRAEYPFTPHFFKVNGYDLHYIDEGSGEILLFVHGTPSWSFDFRNVIRRLPSSFRCIAIDHIGFGLSDKPEHYDYSTLTHSQTLEKFILEKQLTDITLVVHDFGGPIGLNVALHHPDKIKNIVILNSWLWDSSSDPDFIKVSKVLKSPLLSFLYRYLNFSPRFILPNSFGAHKISKKLLRQYTAPFADKTQRNGALAFAKSLLHDQKWFGEIWAKRQFISGKPTLFIWGMRDPILKKHYLEKFISGFEHTKVVELATSGHFPQEEEPEIVAKEIHDFISSI